MSKYKDLLIGNVKNTNYSLIEIVIGTDRTVFSTLSSNIFQGDPSIFSVRPGFS